MLYNTKLTNNMNAKMEESEHYNASIKQDKSGTVFSVCVFNGFTQFIDLIYEGVSRSFRTESITK
jgi:hypothetical protein